MIYFLRGINCAEIFIQPPSRVPNVIGLMNGADFWRISTGIAGFAMCLTVLLDECQTFVEKYDS